MEIDDIPAVYHLGEKLFTSEDSPMLYRTWDPYEVVECFASDPEYCLVGEANEKIVGFLLATTFEKEGTASLEKRLESIWDHLEEGGIDRAFLLSRSLLSPATCCLVNPDGEKTVEKAFSMIKDLSERLRSRYGLEDSTRNSG